jgi:dipeptidase E
MEGMRQIVAFGGGGFSMEAGNPLMDEYVLGLVARPRPRVCFLPSASGDADHYIVRFYRHFAADRCEPSHVSLFRRERGVGGDLREHLLAQDLIYVGGGSLISLLGGLSAGSLCWFAEGVSAFHGPAERVRGLGLLPHSNAVHYDGDRNRRAAFHRFLAAGMPAGYACEDGAALHFVGTELAHVVSSRPGARAFHVRLAGRRVREKELPGEYLGAGSVAELPTAAAA